MDNADRVWRERGLRSAVLSGDERAWRTWYDDSFPGLVAYVSWRCRGLRDLVEEVVQETWLIAVRRIRRFHPEQASFRAWLRGIAANVMRNQIRRYRHRSHRRSANGDIATMNFASTERNDRDRAERIAEALTCLPDRYEAVLRAKYLDQQSIIEIAAAWQESPKAVESLLTRARQAFREAYQQLE